MKLVEQLSAPAGGGHAVSLLCRLLHVAPSGYYRPRTPAARQRRQARKAAEEALVQELRHAFVASHETYGSRRLTAALRSGPSGPSGPSTVQTEARGAVNHKRVERLARLHELVPHTVKRLRSLSRRAPGRQPAPNRLDQRFVAERPNQVWLVDTTEFATQQGKLYLAVVEDLCSRRVVGWTTGERFDQQLVATALRLALQRRAGAKGTLTGLVHHSDQGAQYTAADYLALLEASGLTASMSGVGCCYDNAPMESFIGTLKVEWTHPFTYATRRQLEQDLFDFIEGFYNPTRLHSALGYLSPVSFEQRFHQQHLHTETQLSHPPLTEQQPPPQV